MKRALAACIFALLPLAIVSSALGWERGRVAPIHGDYLESRTCDVYTGPCFANSEVGLTGSEAMMAWSIEQGSFDGVDLSGLCVVLAVRASDTLGFGGGLTIQPDPIRAVALVDQKATAQQRAALVQFACASAGRAAGEITRVHTMPISISIDHINMIGILDAGGVARVETRKLTHHDCICTNEIVFYPPLADVENYEPAFATQSEFSGRGLGTRWDNQGTRSAFLATFSY